MSPIFVFLMAFGAAGLDLTLWLVQPWSIALPLTSIVLLIVGFVGATAGR